MSAWTDQILSQFTADLSRLWVACDPDNVLLDETLLTELRNRGFEVMLYEDPFAFRAEFEERYRGAWDRGESGPFASLVVHLRAAEPSMLPWDILHRARLLRMSLAELLPRLAYSIVAQVQREHLAALFDAHEAELQSARGENESRDFILEHVYGLTPRSIRTPVDFWRELLRMHFANRTLPRSFAEHAAEMLRAKGLFADQPVAEWLSSKNAMLRVLQGGWSRYLASLGVDSSPLSELHPPSYGLEIPFGHPDVQTLVDSMFLDGNLHPLLVQRVPAGVPNWIKAGIVQDPAALQTLVLKGIEELFKTVPAADASHRDWSEFAKRFAEVLARFHALPDCNDGRQDPLREQLLALRTLSDRHLQDWVAANHYADLMLQPVAKGPVMVHHIPRYMRHRRGAGESKLALLVFDGLSLDQWVQVRDRMLAQTRKFAFDEGTAFAWIPTVTSVSRQAIFSGLKPREFEDSIDRTDKEEALWKTFWQNEGVSSGEVFYQRKLRDIAQLPVLEAEILRRRSSVLGLVIDEVDDRLHKERTKKDVAVWIGRWLEGGFVERLFALLLDKGFHIYLTADHGNVESTGVGRPNQGVIAETRGERVRAYRSEDLLAESVAAYPDTVRLNIAGLPANFMPLFAGGRTAFTTPGDQVVAHGGVSVEELIVPFIKVSYAASDK